jgi:hypothetical protein
MYPCLKKQGENSMKIVHITEEEFQRIREIIPSLHLDLVEINLAKIRRIEFEQGFWEGFDAGSREALESLQSHIQGKLQV